MIHKWKDIEMYFHFKSGFNLFSITQIALLPTSIYSSECVEDITCDFDSWVSELSDRFEVGIFAMNICRVILKHGISFKVNFGQGNGPKTHKQ